MATNQPLFSDVPLQMDPSAASKPSFYRYLSAAKKQIAKSIPLNPHIGSKTEYSSVDPLMPTKRHRKRYHTSIERWQPGPMKITCPHCGASVRPTIRSVTNRTSPCVFGAAFMLTCWPLCFAPCMFATASTQDRLHCSACGLSLGVYDRRTGVVTPSKVSIPPIFEIENIPEDVIEEAAEPRVEDMVIKSDEVVSGKPKRHFCCV